MANIAFFEVTKEERNYLKKIRIPNHKITLFEDRADKVPISQLKNFSILSVFIYSQLPGSLISKLPKLDMVASRSTGFDHIDLKTCRTKKIMVANVPSYGENTVAEHTFALILALSRKTHEAYFRTIRGNFSFEGLQGFDLQGKTLGIIGTGHIGLHTIRIAKGFGMKVIAFDVKRNAFMAETLGYEYADFDRVLNSSDIISLHAPYNKATHHMINKSNIKKIKKGAILINTARGGLVETSALSMALDEKILSGAGLDVLEGENFIKEERQILAADFPSEHLKTLVQNHMLLNRENVVITPHIAFNSHEAFLRILETTIGNIKGFLNGSPENIVKPLA